MVPKPCKTAKFFNQLNVFPMSPVFVTTPFLVQKALKTANSEKFVFRVRRRKWCPSLQVRSFSAENRLQAFAVLRIPFSVPKSREFQPAELVAACHRFVTTRFLGAKVRKTGPSSGAPSPQGFSRPDSPPRTRPGVRQPAEVVRQPSPLKSPLHPAPFFGAKSASHGRVRRVRFSCRTASGMPKPPNSQVLVENGLQTTTLLSPLSGRKSGEFQPAEHVTACHRFVTALFGAEKCAKGLEKAKPAPRLRTWVWKTWLILPVVICLSQSRS